MFISPPDPKGVCSTQNQSAKTAPKANKTLAKIGRFHDANDAQSHRKIGTSADTARLNRIGEIWKLSAQDTQDPLVDNCASITSTRNDIQSHPMGAEMSVTRNANAAAIMASAIGSEGVSITSGGVEIALSSASLSSPEIMSDGIPGAQKGLVQWLDPPI